MPGTSLYYYIQHGLRAFVIEISRDLSQTEHDVTSSTLVFQNNETAVMLVYHANPVGFELFSYVNISICFNKFVYVLAMRVKTLHNLKS